MWRARAPFNGLKGLWLRIWGLGFRIEGLGLRVSGLGDNNLPLRGFVGFPGVFGQWGNGKDHGNHSIISDVVFLSPPPPHVHVPSHDAEGQP